MPPSWVGSGYFCYGVGYSGITRILRHKKTQKPNNAQQVYRGDLHRHLDSAAPETSIGDIVDSCRIWESHAELIAIDNWCQNTLYSQPTLLMPPPVTGGSARLRYRVGSVMPALNESPRRVRHSSADRELLILKVLEAVGARRNVMSERSRSREVELLLQDMPPVGSVMKEKTSPPASQPDGGTPPLTDDLGDRGQCFSCGFLGHGVNRCSQLDRSFPYKMPGKSLPLSSTNAFLENSQLKVFAFNPSSILSVHCQSRMDRMSLC